VALSNSEDEAVVVAPKLDGLVSGSGNEPVSARGDVETSHLSLSTVDDPDRTSVVGVPVGDFEVTAASQVLRLVGVEEDVPENGRFEHSVDPETLLGVPDNARAVSRRGNGLDSRRVADDGGDHAPMLLHGVKHALVGVGDLPDPDPSVSSSTDDPPRGASVVVVADAKGGAALGVSLVNDEPELAGLGVEGTDLSVAPGAHDGATTRGKVNGVAGEVRDLDPQKFLTKPGVPDANVLGGGGDEKVGAIAGELDVVDLSIMAGAAELWLERLHVDIVPLAKVGSGVETNAGWGDTETRDTSSELGPVLGDAVKERVEELDGTVSSSSKDVGVAGGRVEDAGNTLDSLAEPVPGVV